jgi:hypothetical protein
MPDNLKPIAQQEVALICAIDSTAEDSIGQRKSKILNCDIKAIDNPELTIDYIAKEDSSLIFYISHSLSGDSLYFQRYSLREILCIIQNESDTIEDYQSNMMLKQDKNVYAGAPSLYYLKFQMNASSNDTIRLVQKTSEGPINFPPIVLNQLLVAHNVNTAQYDLEITTGTVAFYTQHRLGKLDVYVDENYIGTIHKRFASKKYSPDCGEIGETLVNKRILSGKHTYTIRSAKYQWDGEFYMLRESCVKINIEK